MFQGNETVTVISHTAGTVDEYGIPTQSTTETTVQKCLVEFDHTSEPTTVDADPIVQSATVYLPVGTDVDRIDQFEIRGESWVKDGEAVQWESPFSRPIPFIVVKVRRRIA